MSLKERILTQSQLDLIQNELISVNHKRIFSIARYTGQKFKYICNLKVSDVYNEDDVPHAVVNFSGRLLGVHKSVVCSKLSELLIYCRPEISHRDHLLFPSPLFENKPISLNTIDRFIKSASRKAGLENFQVSPNSIRKAFIKSLYDNGISRDVIKEILGIKSDSQFLVYAESKPIDHKTILDNFLI